MTRRIIYASAAASLSQPQFLAMHTEFFSILYLTLDSAINPLVVRSGWFGGAAAGENLTRPKQKELVMRIGIEAKQSTRQTAPGNRWFGALPRRIALSLFTAVVAACGVPTLAGPLDVGGKKDLTVYQANAFIGGEIEKALTVDPSKPAEVLKTVTEIYMEVLASDPPKHMTGLADEIVSARPDLVSLEEVYTIEKAPATDQGAPGDFAVVFDYLQLLTDTLAAKGVHYKVAVVSTESDVVLPMLDPQTGNLAFGRAIDHEAILVRTDLPPGYLKVANPQSGRFSTYLQVPGAGISVYRGWCSVDVFTRGERFRYICAHLEEETVPPIQMAQALELLGGPAKTPMPVLIAGDFNADPLHRTGTTTYDAFIAAGFSDAWLALNPNDPAGGLTWGHDPFLADPATPFIWRLDLVFSRGGIFAPVESEVLDPLLGSTPPLWPSDHAALTVCFRLGNPKALSGSGQNPH